MKTNLLAKLLVLTLSLVFTFCGDDTTTESTIFAYSVDGVTKNVQSITGTMQSEIQFGHEGQSLHLDVSNNMSQTVTLNVSNWDFQKPPKDGIIEREYDATFDTKQMNGSNPKGECLALTGANAGITLCDGGFITFTSGGEVYTSLYSGNTDATIKITKCTKRKISGSFTASLKNSNGKKLSVSGSFKNVKYKV